jgi:S1-C subfamily serine protease
MSEPAPGPSRVPTLSLPWLAAFLAVALVAGLASGAAVALLTGNSSEGDSGESNQAVARAVARALPSVVAIVNEIAASGDNPGGIAGGAGVIIDDRGYVLTNAHIVSIPGRLFVLLSDGETRPATLVSDDAPFTDVAVLQINQGGLHSLPLGDSDELALGETVIALGSPDIDYMNSASVGVVSGLERRKQLGDVWLEDLIQTDAAINVGNSGGPLVNLDGEVVGLVTFRDLGAEDPLFGISFAIPSRTIQPIARSMVDNGEFPRAYFGIEHQDVTQELAGQLGLRTPQGAVVRRVFSDSPAQRAGLRVGDVILRIGRFDINEQFTFLNALALAPADGRVTVRVLRGGEQVDVAVQLAPR